MTDLLLAVFVTAMLGAFLGIARTDRRALPPLMLTAALVITLGALASAVLPH